MEANFALKDGTAPPNSTDNKAGGDASAGNDKGIDSRPADLKRSSTTRSRYGSEKRPSEGGIVRRLSHKLQKARGGGSGGEEKRAPPEDREAAVSTAGTRAAASGSSRDRERERERDRGDKERTPTGEERHRKDRQERRERAGAKPEKEKKGFRAVLKRLFTA